MAYYLIFFWLSCWSFTKENFFIKKINYLILLFFLCFSYELGSDLEAYQLIFKNFPIQNIQEFNYEKGFILYNEIMKLFFDFWGYYIITKILIFYIFYRIYKLLNVNKSFMYVLFCTNRSASFHRLPS